MKLTYEDEHVTVSINDNQGVVSFMQYVELVAQLALGAGFDANTVEKYFFQEYSEKEI